MALELQEMTGEELLLNKALGDWGSCEQIDGELDRRALAGPPARCVAVRCRSRVVRRRSIPGQLVA